VPIIPSAKCFETEAEAGKESELLVLVRRILFDLYAESFILTDNLVALDFEAIGGKFMSRKVSARPLRTTLSETTDHRMKLYAVAAAAAGVSMLALAQPADAEVVITRKNIPIPLGSYDTGTFPVPIDLNHDGINDFSFSLSSFAYHSFDAALEVRALTGGEVVGNEGKFPRPYASALVRGAKIGPPAHFSAGAAGSATIARSHGEDINSTFYSRKTYGKWGGNPPNRYLGVKFLIDGEIHYGWVRLTVIWGPHRNDISATITAYAYESVANKPTFAGIPEGAADIQAQPKAESLGRASLGMLASGAAGLALWRRDEVSPN
jgi:hypothetical protein